MARKTLHPVHPGEILLTEFLQPMEITPYRLSKDIGVPQTRVSRILHHERAITPDTALRLARYFGTTPEFWSNLQVNYDLKTAILEQGSKIEREVKPRAA